MEKAMKKAKNLLILASCLLAASLLTSCESDDGGGGDHPYQGNYAGTYSGGYAGTWQVTVHGDGSVTGVAHNAAEGLDYGVAGTVTVHRMAAVPPEVMRNRPNSIIPISAVSSAPASSESECSRAVGGRSRRATRGPTGR